MKKSLLSTVFLASLIISQSILAAPKGQIRGGLCISHTFQNTSSVFTCDHIGQNTISQIYEKGWRIVSTYTQDHRGYHTTTLIIEQQG